MGLVDDQFSFQIDPLEADRARLIFGASYRRKADAWVCPATRTQVAQLKGLFGLRIRTTQPARDKAVELTEYTGDLTYKCDFRLFPFQRDGVAFLLSAGSSLLGDEMGTGKTIQALTWMANLSPKGKHLVVCPNSLKYNWESEAAMWWPEVPVTVVDGTASKRRKQIESFVAGVLIINYKGLTAHTRLAPWGGKALTVKQKTPGLLNEISWDTVVVDEAHKIKDPKAIQTMAVKQMGLQAEHRLAMTGTPVVQNPDDVWSIMNFVEPKEWGSRTQFRNRYCRMQSAWHGGFENLGLLSDTREEFDSFFGPRFLRRTKEEVLPQLPEKFPIEYRYLPMGTKQAKVYNALAKDMMAVVDNDLLVAENPLSLLIRLRQAACGVLEVEDGKVVAINAPSNKLDAILDILEGAPDDQLAVYAESRKFVEMLEFELTKKHYTVGMVTGDRSSEQRTRAVERFQAGETQVMLGTLGAGAEGLTLTAANRIVLAQQSWAHATNAQAIDRLHRIGQERGVQPIVLLSQGTVDLATALVDKNKEARLQDLVRDPAWFKAAMKGEL